MGLGFFGHFSARKSTSPLLTSLPFLHSVMAVCDSQMIMLMLGNLAEEREEVL